MITRNRDLIQQAMRRVLQSGHHSQSESYAVEITLYDCDTIFESTDSRVDIAIKSIQNAPSIGYIIKQLNDVANGEADAENAARGIAAYGVIKRGQEARKNANAAAKEVLERVKGDPSKLTDEDRAILAQYSGRGGISGENSLFEYYTPPEIAEGTWDLLKANGFENGNVLEPSVGAGVFMHAKPSGVKMLGVEIDETSSGVAALLHPTDTVRNQSFEKLCTNTEDNTFDSVIGNVPFGDSRGAYAQDDDAYQEIKQIERYFVTRAIDKVKHGGLVCLIVPVNIVQSQNATFKKWRRELSLKAEFLGAHKLPSGTFGGANGNGTDTVTDVILFQKHSKAVTEKVRDMASKDLEAANVIWPTWTDGKWFKSPEGARYIHGTLIPAPEGSMHGDKVKSDLTNSQIKKIMAVKFHSRINFALLDTAPTIIRNYADGDRRSIAGVDHEFVGGEWVRIEADISSKGHIDARKFGVSTVEEMKEALSGTTSGLVLTFEQARAAVSGDFATTGAGYVNSAVKIAKAAPPEMRERVYRAALLGMRITQYTVQLNQGEIDDSDKPQRLEELQQLVTAEVTKYGNPSDLMSLRINVPGSNAIQSFASSIKKDGGLSDLLAGNVQRANAAAYDSEDFADVVRYMTARHGNPIMPEDVMELYTGKGVVNELILTSDIAINPNGTITTMARYASGNVVNKVSELHKAITDPNTSHAMASKYRKQLEAIEKARNKTGIDGITFDPRNRWIPAKYVKEFLSEKGFNRVSLGDDGNWETFSYSKPVGFEKHIPNYLNGKSISASVNTAEYKAQASELSREFDAWIKQHEDAEFLVSVYNDVFNANIPFAYDDSELGITGLSGAVKPHGYQNSGIRRLSEEGRGILAYDVGLGKTFTALSLAAYNAQNGRAKRTCITVPKAVLENWYHEAKQLYGNLDHAIFVGFTPELNNDTGTIKQAPVLDEQGNQRKNKLTGEPEYRDVLKEDSNETVLEKMHQIPTTNRTLVIMTKERFGEIPMRPETRESYTDKMASNRLLSDAKAKEFLIGKNVKGSYADAKKSQQYQSMYANQGSSKKNDYPYFEQMGFDSVIVDEAHEFKNAYEANSETAKLAYLPTAPASKRSIDMAAKMAYLRENNGGRGPVLLSATPVTNSPTEIFNMLSYVMDVSEFEAMGIRSVDDFIRIYCDTETVDVTKLSGKTEAKEAVVGFRNLDGLRSLYGRFVNAKKAQDVNDAANSLKIPDAEERHENVEMTLVQKQIYEGLRMQADGYEFIGGVWVEVPKEMRRPVFSIIRDMDRVTTDLDLYRRTMSFTFQLGDEDKVRKLVDDLPPSKIGSDSHTVIDDETGKRRKMTDDELEEADLVSGAVDLADKLEINVGECVTLVVPEEYEDDVVSRLAQFGIVQKTVAHPVTPKYARLLERLRVEYEAGGKQIVFTEEKSQHDKIKRLIVHHLPIEATEVEIINASTADGKNLERITAAYNTGKARIVIANKKAEVGVNLQRGTTAIHHLTFPWTPASIQQRNGRGVRQGNSAAKVQIFYYQGKGSFDSYRLEMLKRKSDWLESLFTGDATKAENANAGANDEFAAMLASDPEEFKRRITEQRERKAREERIKANTKAISELSQLMHTRRRLSNLATEKEDALKAITYLGSDKQKEDYKLAADNQVLAHMLAKDKKRADESTNRLPKIERQEAELKQKERAIIANLTSQQDGGRIDIDAKACIASGEYVITTGGKVFRVGCTYESKNSGVVFEVTSVNQKEKTIGGKILSSERGYSSGFYEIEKGRMQTADSVPNDTIEIKISREDIYQNQIIKQFEKGSPISYRLLLSGQYRVRDEWFASKGNNYINKTTTECAFGVDSSGKFSLFSPRESGEKYSFVYPDLTSEEFRKNFAGAVISKLGQIETGINADTLRKWDVINIASVVFGKDKWEEEISKYGTKATPEDVERIAVDYFTKASDFVQSLTVARSSAASMADAIAEKMKPFASAFAAIDTQQFINTVKEQVPADSPILGNDKELANLAAIVRQKLAGTYKDAGSSNIELLKESAELWSIAKARFMDDIISYGIDSGYINAPDIFSAYSVKVDAEIAAYEEQIADIRDSGIRAKRDAVLARMATRAIDSPDTVLEESRNFVNNALINGVINEPTKQKLKNNAEKIAIDLSSHVLDALEKPNDDFEDNLSSFAEKHDDESYPSNVADKMKLILKSAIYQSAFGDIINYNKISNEVGKTDRRADVVANRSCSITSSIGELIFKINGNTLENNQKVDIDARSAWLSFYSDASAALGNILPNNSASFSRTSASLVPIENIISSCKEGFFARFSSLQNEQEQATFTSALISQALIAKLDSIKITARVNESPLIYTVGKKTKIETAAPGAYLLMKDRAGFNGKLRHMAESWLKSNFGAFFSYGVSGFGDNCWMIPLDGIDINQFERSLDAKLGTL